MTDEVLTPERILEAAEEVLRRFGPSKTTVVDVARALKVSHGSVYRHFPSKAALRDAVAHRWLARVVIPLEAIVSDPGPAPERLRRWFDTLIALKRTKVTQDPELFATYLALAQDVREVTREHVDTLAAHLSKIIADGVARGEMVTDDAATAGRAALDATSRFHHPAHAMEWSEPGIDEKFEAVWRLLSDGLGIKRDASGRR